MQAGFKLDTDNPTMLIQATITIMLTMMTASSVAEEKRETLQAPPSYRVKHFEHATASPEESAVSPFSLSS